ncbi:MAG TPA: hypothetical protein VMG59_01460 [Phycisphaerae bacterium]|nr:hypothetical protein [Phycisphaerae bacterium]
MYSVSNLRNIVTSPVQDENGDPEFTILLVGLSLLTLSILSQIIIMTLPPVPLRFGSGADVSALRPDFWREWRQNAWRLSSFQDNLEQFHSSFSVCVA